MSPGPPIPRPRGRHPAPRRDLPRRSGRPRPARPGPSAAPALPGPPPAPSAAPAPASLLRVELLQTVPHGGLAGPRALALLEEAWHILHVGKRSQNGAATEKSAPRGRLPEMLTHFRRRAARGTPGAPSAALGVRGLSG